MTSDTAALAPRTRGGARLAAWTAWALVGAGAGAALSALGTGALPFADEPLCALRRVALVGCPTCGLTRSIAALARGELVASLALHPWGVPLAAQLLAAWAAWGLWLAGRLARCPDRWLPRAVAWNAAALGLLWAVRFMSGLLP